MVNFIEFVFFVYMFIGLYMISLLILIYLPHRKDLFKYPKGKPEKVSIILPCFNAEKTIGPAIDSLLNMDYPRDMFEIIVVDDKSSDGSVRIVREYVKKYDNVRLIVHEKNSGGAAEPTNTGVKAAKYDYITVADDDSIPNPDALIKMIGFLQEDERVGGVTCSVLVHQPKSFMQKLQSVEYAIIAWTRKLLDKVDAVYVTPGPFALYRKKVLIEIGLFDKTNLTQDIEIVWRMLSRGYRARMCLAARVYTISPRKFRVWWKQRLRWNIGGTQTLLKYRKYLFRKGMLGNFVVPYFSASLFIGLFGLGIFFYLITRRILVYYLSTRYSLYADSTILHLQDLTFSPSVLNFFGGVLFLLGIGFTLFALGSMKELRRKYVNVFNIGFYMLVYLSIYPLVMVVGLYKLYRGKYSW